MMHEAKEHLLPQYHIVEEPCSDNDSVYGDEVEYSIRPRGAKASRSLSRSRIAIILLVVLALAQSIYILYMTFGSAKRQEISMSTDLMILHLYML